MTTLHRSFDVECLEARRLLSFAAPVNCAGGPNPQAVVTGDFNNDGKLDLAVANHDNGTVSVLPGDGQGEFGAARVSAVGTGPLSLTVADFNKDGKLDLAVITQDPIGNIWNSGMAVVLGNGDGTFRAPTALGTTCIPLAAGAGDFNADGKIDVVVGEDDFEGAGYVEVLRGNGLGGFTAATGQSLAHSLPAPSMAVGDLNGDGKLDAVMVCGPGGSGGFALLGNGNGTFGPYGLDWPQFDTGEDPRAVAVGDFTGDGIPDLISAGQTVDVLRGHGDGSFDAPINQIADGSMHTGVAVADFTGDGKLDAATSDADTGTVSLMTGNGNTTLTYAGAYGVGPSPSAVAVRDFNGDGRPDVAAANSGSNNVSVLINDGNWVSKTYVGPNSGGNWSTAANWSPSGVPIASDNVAIAGKSVSLSSNASVAGLTLTGGAKLDLKDHDLIINYTGGSPIGSWNGSAYTGVTGMIQSGRNGGAWNGAGIITTMTDAIGPAARKTLGILQTASSVVVRYTFAGDADLSGGIDGDDFFAIDSGYAPQARAYAIGDFDYNGRTDADDYWLIDSNYGKQTLPAAPGDWESTNLVGAEWRAGPIRVDDSPSAYERLSSDR